MIIGPTSHKGEVFGGLGLAWHKRTFFDMPSSRRAVYPHSSSFKHSRCFAFETSADGAADLLEVLRNSPLEELSFFDLCSQIPSAAWQRVPSGAWPVLRDAPGIPEEEFSRIVSGGAADGSFCRGRLVFGSDSGRTSEPWVEP